MLMKYSAHKSYYYNGKEVPSVTTVLRILNTPELIGWANYLGFKGENVNRVLDETAQFGTFIHSMIESIIMGNYIVYHHNEEFSFGVLDVVTAIRHFREWYDNHRVEPIFQETSFSSEKFAGTLDFYGKVNGKYTLVDFKTSKDIRLKMFIQLGLYIHLLEKYGYKVDQCGIVLANTKKAKNKFVSRKAMDPFIEMGLRLVDLFHMDENIKLMWKSLQK